ncbi:MAG TPA: hypothetical protein VFS46_07745 [Nitrososphaera sp.]|nr:hypothetical protein [Nitrososphaera sp.]
MLGRLTTSRQGRKIDMLAAVGRAIREIVAMKIHFRYHVVSRLPEAGCEYCNMR